MNNNGTRIKNTRLTWIAVLAGLGTIATVSQVFYLKIYDTILCLNQGCQVVESQLRISPLWLNGAGALFFFQLLALAVMSKRRPTLQIQLRVLLLCGMAAEGVLVAYQAFVVQTFCSYCLALCCIIIVMNVLAGWRQACAAILLFLSELLIFSLLQFHNPTLRQGSFTIDQGTYGVKQCTRPQRHLYLLFSSDCPHCRRVLDLLSTCTRCEIRFNPVQRIDRQVLPDLEFNDSWDPGINALALKILGIETIPVLIEKRNNGLRFIRGEKEIMGYLQQNCLAPLSENQESQEEFNLFDFTDQGECRMDTDCTDQK